MITERQHKDKAARSGNNMVQFPLQRAGASFSWDAKGFYTPKDAARIARVHRATVASWDRKGIVVPTLVWTDEEGREIQGYSFAGLVYLRLIRMLRNESLPLRKIVIAVSHLVDVFGPPGPNWENARIFSDGHDIWIDHKNEWGVTAATRHGQKAAHELFGPEFALLRERADALVIPRQFANHVEIDPNVRNGHPVIRHTVIETKTIRALRKQGLTYSEIRDYYPHLLHEQIVRADKYEHFLDIETIAA